VGILIAALGGLAVGMEREWSGHASGPQPRFAGVRTFTLLGILSGISGWLWSQHFEPLAIILLMGAAAIVVVAYAAASRLSVEATTEVASFVVLASGVAAGLGFWALAAGTVAVTTLLLVEKSFIHDIARRLDDTSLRAAVRFGVMAVVILPLLPEGPFGPGAGFKPRTLWLAVLIFSGLSFVGYLARKSLSGTFGYPVAGLLGGLMSSTVVTLSFSRLSRSQRGAAAPLAVGVVGASTVLFVRVLVATATLNPPLALGAAPYFAIPFASGAAATVSIWRIKGTAPSETAPEVRNPLQFWNSIQMAALFQVVLYLMHWFQGVFGDQGLLTSGAILGLTNMDALTLSMARGVETTDWSLAGKALSIGILSNTLLKAVLAVFVGEGHFRWLTLAGLCAIGAGVVFSIFMVCKIGPPRRTC
jgi:uncharacterized membrane protein (DUF4010 family)